LPTSGDGTSRGFSEQTAIASNTDQQRERQQRQHRAKALRGVQEDQGDDSTRRPAFRQLMVNLPPGRQSRRSRSGAGSGPDGCTAPIEFIGACAPAGSR
jgi:hypothetical protein